MAREVDAARLREYNAELERLNQLERERGSLSEKDIRRRTELNLLIESYNRLLRTNVEEIGREVEVLKELNEVTEANIEELNRLIAVEENDIRTRKASNTLGIEEEARIRKKIKDLQEQQQSIKNVTRATQDFLTTATGIDDRWKNTLLGSIISGNSKESLQAYAEQFKKQLSFENLMGSTMLKIQEATVATFFAMDEAFSSFASATGATAKYNDVINQAARGNTALGISFAQSAKATTELYNNLASFTRLNQSSQAQLVTTTAKLERLGISGTDTARSIGTLSIAMGISQVQAAKVVEKFAAMGQAIGVSSKQMISDFMAVKDQLAVFGKNMDKTFTDLAAQAKATGVALTDLLNIANKFDTFEGAANQVGKLNAILGGPYLSAMSMIEETDPTKRIDMLRQAVNNAGMSFENMSYYEQKAIMEAGGFKSVDEAQKILSKSAGQYAKELENQKAKEDEMNAAIERTIPIKEKLTLLMSNFALIMQPVVEMVSKFITVLTYMIDNPVGRMIVSFITIIGLIKTVTVVWKALDLVFTTSGIGLVIKLLAVLAAVFFNVHDALLVPHSPILFDALKALPDIFRSIGEMALAFAASITVVAFALPIMATGLFSVAAGIVAFSAAMLVAAGAGVVNSIASLFGADLASQITDIADALAEIPDDKIYNFKVAMEKVVEVSQPTTLAGFEQFAERFDLVAQATAKVDASKTQTFTNMLTATQNLSQALKVNNTVIVKIGEKKFEAIIEEVLNKVMGDQAISRPAGT